MQVGWQGGADALAQNVEDYWSRVEARLPQELEAVGRKAVAFAVSNHPWTNRTGEAERGLSYEVIRTGDAILITLFHRAPHGIWLETRWAGKWGVLPKAMTSVYGDVMLAVQRAMGG